MAINERKGDNVMETDKKERAEVMSQLDYVFDGFCVWCDTELDDSKVFAVDSKGTKRAWHKGCWADFRDNYKKIEWAD